MVIHVSVFPLLALDRSPKASSDYFPGRSRCQGVDVHIRGGHAALGCYQVFSLRSNALRRASLLLPWSTWVGATSIQHKDGPLVTTAPELGSNTRRKTGLHLDSLRGEQFQPETRKYPVSFRGPVPLSHF